MNRTIDIDLEINGQQITAPSLPMARLLDVIRELGFTGTKEGCGEGECGACSVILNGELVNSCLVPVAQAHGARIKTVEGLTLDGQLSKVQDCFIKLGGAQCGICTPGMLMATCHLLSHNATPDTQAIREGLAGNLCRCTGFTKIIEAVQMAVSNKNP